MTDDLGRGSGLQCPDCGRQAQSGEELCASCGYPLLLLWPKPEQERTVARAPGEAEVRPVPPPAITDDAPAPPASEAPRPRPAGADETACSACGAPNARDRTLCRQCGQRLPTSATTSDTTTAVMQPFPPASPVTVDPRPSAGEEDTSAPPGARPRALVWAGAAALVLVVLLAGLSLYRVTSGVPGAVVGTPVLNVRSGPGTRFDDVGDLQRGDRVRIHCVEQGFGRTYVWWDPRPRYVGMGFIRTDSSPPRC